MGQAGLGHDLVDPNPIDTLLAEKPGGNANDPIVIFGPLGLGQSHGPSPFMTVVTYN
jgi:hypothetical protein